MLCTAWQMHSWAVHCRAVQYHCEVCRAWVALLKEGVIVTSCLAAWHLAEGHPLEWSGEYATPLPHAENAMQRAVLLYKWQCVQPSACTRGVTCKEVWLQGCLPGGVATGVHCQSGRLLQVLHSCQGSLSGCSVSWGSCISHYAEPS